MPTQINIEEYIKGAFMRDAVEIGRFSVKLIANKLEEVKEELALPEYDQIVFREGPHRSGEADIELIKNKKTVLKMSVKTAVKGDILKAFIRAQNDMIFLEMDGLLVIVLRCIKGEKWKDVVGIIRILHNGAGEISINSFQKWFNEWIENKRKSEGFDEITPVAIDEAIMLQGLILAMDSGEKARKAWEAAEKAWNAAVGAEKESKKALDAALKAKNESEKAWRAALEAKNESEKAWKAALEAKSESEKAWKAALEAKNESKEACKVTIDIRDKTKKVLNRAYELEKRIDEINSRLEKIEELMDDIRKALKK